VEDAVATPSRILADRFDEAVSEFIRTVEGLSETEWRLLCPDEERAIGVVAHHVAEGIAFQMKFFRQIAAGRQPPAISEAYLAEANARDATRWADISQAATLALLRRNARAAAAEVRQWSADQLARRGRYLADLPEAWTVETWLDRLLIGHVRGHLASIRAVLDPGGTSQIYREGYC
jgi:hypothetical protein